MVGNVYFWWDFTKIDGKGPDSFPDFPAFQAYLRENITKCEDWLWKAYRGGIFFAGNNLNKLYQDGDEDLIPPQPEKAKGIWRTGAELGYPPHQKWYADELLGQVFTEGSDWGAFYLASRYFNGWGTTKDYKKVLEILDKASWCNKDMYYMLGVIYGQGLGVAADIPKAVGYLQKAGDLKQAKEELLHYKKTLFGKWVRR